MTEYGAHRPGGGVIRWLPSSRVIAPASMQHLASQNLVYATEMQKEKIGGRGKGRGDRGVWGAGVDFSGFRIPKKMILCIFVLKHSIVQARNNFIFPSREKHLCEGKTINFNDRSLFEVAAASGHNDGHLCGLKLPLQIYNGTGGPACHRGRFL